MVPRADSRQQRAHDEAEARGQAGYIDPTLDAGVVPFAPTFTPSSVTG